MFKPPVATVISPAFSAKAAFSACVAIVAPTVAIFSATREAIRDMIEPLLRFFATVPAFVATVLATVAIVAPVIIAFADIYTAVSPPTALLAAHIIADHLTIDPTT